MLKANVGLSRKITHDYNSTGYSVNLEGEILAAVDDPEAITEKIRELFNLAQEALDIEIDRDQGEDAIGRRDEERPSTNDNPSNVNKNGQQSSPKTTPPPQPQKPTQSQSPSSPQNGHQSPSPPQNGHQNGTSDAATNKQVQFLLNMGKKLKLTTPQLEGRVQEIIGRRCGVYELSKREAGIVLDQFTKATNDNCNGTGTGNGNRR